MISLGDHLDPRLLRSFLAAAETRSFTKAGQVLGLQQSTISQQIARLEKLIGRRLFARDTHGITLTKDGNVLVELAGSILKAHERAHRYFQEVQLHGVIRFGTVEDFALSHLPHILGNFAKSHPLVDLELTVGLSSGPLMQKLESGELDLILAKCRPGDQRGRTLWRRPLHWIAPHSFELDPDEPVPLIVLTAPSVSRVIALEALERAGRSWHIVCTTSSLAGCHAAAMAGLGVMIQSQGLLPDGLIKADPRLHLPHLGEIEYVLMTSNRRRSSAVASLAFAILDSEAKFDEIWSSPGVRHERRRYHTK